MIDFRPRSATIEGVESMVPEHALFTFRLADDLGVAPGQFVELSVPGAGAFPVSTAALTDGLLFAACIRRAGRVTDALFARQVGDVVGIRGPFGNGFPLPEFMHKDALLIAGGLGMAPLRALLQALLLRPQGSGEIILLYGSREPKLLLFRSELESLAKAGRIHLRFSADFAPETPWAPPSVICRVGLVAGLLGDLPLRPERTVAAVCGPPLLYGCVLEELAAQGIEPGSIYATLERRMQCGVGECCHCAVGGVFVCREGPVFSLAQLRRMPGAI